MTAGRASAVLLACAVLLFAGVELGTRAFIHDMSNVLSRLRRESRAAVSVRPGANGQQQLLIVGNSLLIAGVDVQALDSALGPARAVARFAVENTTYRDWYFGARRLFTQGARPDVLVLFFEERHVLADGIRGEIFAHYLMRTRDAIEVGRAVRFNPTQTSELLAANLSDFWGLRIEIRKVLLGRLIPSLPALTGMMTRGAPAPPADTTAMKTVGVSRLNALKSLADSNGVRFVLVLTPPLPAADAALLLRIGEANGVPVIAPMSDADIRPVDYDQDGYHLNAEGRARYTQAVARELSRALSPR